ncbi:MAG: ABC transporter substrate-binding protein [Eubacterium sp.]|nr:ABC transporter substrate-binding protein [Eubacterium sp.]
MKKRWIALLLTAVLMTAALVGCGGTGDDNGEISKENTLVYGAEFEDDKINPVLSTTYEDDFLFRGLMRQDKNCTPQKDIAKEVEISADKLTYIFTLRDDVKFHDDEGLTADDVVFTIKSIMDPAVNSGRATEFQEVASVEKLEDYKVKITLKQEFPPLLDKLTVGIVPEHILAGQDINAAEFNHNPVGTGPYKFVSWTTGESLTMTRFEDYYGKAPQIENVIFKFLPDYNTRAMQLESGEVDFTFLEPSQVEKIENGENTRVYKCSTADYRCMNYNFAVTDLFEDVRVRQALNYATNREDIVKSIAHGYGYAAYSPLQANKYVNEDVEKYDYDVSKAEALFAEAGWIKNAEGILEKDGRVFAFTLTAPISDEVRVNIANALASEWKKIGALVKVDALDWNAIDIFKCEAFVLGFGSPFDADTDTYPMFVSTQNAAPGQNYGSYNNAAVDAALQAGRVGTSDAERAKQYAAFQQAFAEDPPYDMICYLQALYGANKRVSGVSEERVLGHHGAGIFWNIEDWSLDD